MEKEEVWTCPVCGNEYRASETDEDWIVQNCCDCVDDHDIWE